MTLALRETIFALASAVGKAGVAVFSCLWSKCFRCNLKNDPLNNVEKKKMNVASIYATPEKTANCLIDKGMVFHLRDQIVSPVKMWWNFMFTVQSL